VLRRAARGLKASGLAKILGGTGILIGSIAYLFLLTQHGGYFLYIVPAIGVGLVGAGIRNRTKGRRVAEFCKYHRKLAG